jgi:hypothetical protein
MPVEITVPEVQGDPAGMRMLATSLRSDARSVEGIVSGTASAARSMTFEGPAADRLQTKTQSSSTSLGDCVEQLNDLARLLETWAEEVERRQEARLERIRQLREEFAEQGVPARIS